MRKIWMWMKVSIYIPYFMILHHQLKHKSFNEQFEGARILSRIVLRVAHVRPTILISHPLDKNGTYLFIGNHQSSLDPFLLVDAIEVPVSAVAKEELNKIPVIGSWFRLLQGIGFDRSSIKDGVRMIKDVTQTLKNGRSMIIFPEGTRSNSNQLLEFKAGALKAAYNAQVPIVPFVFVNSQTILDAGKKAPVYIKFLDPIPYEVYQNETTSALSQRLHKMIQDEIDAIILK